MATRTSFALSILALALLTTVPHPASTEQLRSNASAAEVEAALGWEGVRIVDLDQDPERLARMEVIVEGFEAAGLDLPTLSIEVHETVEACHGHDGFIQYVQPAPIISICSDHPYVVPHELAHAWVAANLTDSAKADFVAALGLSSWDDDSHGWNERGTEYAAFVIQQNLTNQPPRMTRTWEERADAFEMLTGQPSPLRAA